MPRFHFMYRCDKERIDDPNGLELPSLLAAYDHANGLIARVIGSSELAGSCATDWRKWAIEVSSSEGNCELVVTYFSRLGAKPAAVSRANRCEESRESLVGQPNIF